MKSKCCWVFAGWFAEPLWIQTQSQQESNFCNRTAFLMNKKWSCSSYWQNRNFKTSLRRSEGYFHLTLLKVGGIFSTLPGAIVAHLEKAETIVQLSWGKRNILYWFISKHFTEFLQQPRTQVRMTAMSPSGADEPQFGWHTLGSWPRPAICWEVGRIGQETAWTLCSADVGSF